MSEGSLAAGSFVAADYAVFAVMLLVSAAVGVYFAWMDRGQASLGDFLMGGRSLTALPVSLSLTASFMSAITVLSNPAEVYRYGASIGFYVLSYMMTMVVTSEIFLPVFYRLAITSTYEYLELRFSRATRLLGTMLFIVQTILYTGIVIYVPALALNQVTGMDLWGAIISTGVVCTFYCTMGGLRAVVWTDVFQLGVMLAGFLSVIIRSVIVQGGVLPIISDAQQGGRLNFGESLYINLVGLCAILLCSVFAGMCLFSVYKDCDPWTAGLVSAPDQLMPYLVMDILGDYPGLPGLFVAAAYSGSLSTVSSSINALAAVTVEDLIKPYSNMSERNLSRTSKGLSLLYGVLCIGMAGLASLMGGILQGALSGLVSGLVMSLWVGIGAQIYPPPHEMSRPLSLTTEGCNFTATGSLNWTSTALPTQTASITTGPAHHLYDGPPLADSWYSLSYLYFSPIGTIVAVSVGLVYLFFMARYFLRKYRASSSLITKSPRATSFWIFSGSVTSLFFMKADFSRPRK
ncbi:Sodium-coupled monocarboxylate transporter 1 [Liparis tanakae]|uniref:Sodium-coupled monocarboxylate transporter 1 n=1 Tax=Liparis tanakae TaxID=230148 RepID=A0A4Z2GA98_9TELE|nr:Sodium-coupled monocarboxylate transporter 1 [Liparis tanakae]